MWQLITKTLKPRGRGQMFLAVPTRSPLGFHGSLEFPSSLLPFPLPCSTLTRTLGNSKAAGPLASIPLPFGDLVFAQSPRWLCGVEGIWKHQGQQFSLSPVARN